MSPALAGRLLSAAPGKPRCVAFLKKHFKEDMKKGHLGVSLLWVFCIFKIFKSDFSLKEAVK